MADPPRPQSPSSISGGVVASVAALFAALGLHPIVTPDLWWHLASGRWVVREGAVPRFDPLSYTMSQHEWINLQWLGDVVTYGAWLFGGADALVLGKCLLLALLGVGLVRSMVAHGAGPWGVALVGSLAALVCAERTLTRPEIFSYAAAAGMFAVLAQPRPGRWLAALPLLTVVWVNVHSLAFLAPLSVGWSALLATLDRRADGPRARPRWILAALCVLALLLNPYGFAAWTFPLTLFERIAPESDVFSRILEFASPWADPGDPILRPFWCLLVALGASLALRFRRLPVTTWLWPLPFLALAFLARRNLPWAALAIAPVVAAAWSSTRAADASPSNRSWFRGGSPAAIVPLVLAILVLGGGRSMLTQLPRATGVGVAAGTTPAAATEALAAIGSGRVFNDLDFGGYLSWAAPGLPPFIDGRLEVAGDEWLARYIRAHEDPQVWNVVRDSWDIDRLLLQHGEAGSAAFLRALVRGKEWRLIALTPTAAALVPRTAAPSAELRWPDALEFARILDTRRDPEPHGGDALRGVAELLHRLHPSPSPDAVQAANRLANALLTLDQVERARVGFDEILAAAPDDATARFGSGACERRRGNPDAARREWERALDTANAAQRAQIRRALETLTP